jgi:hypothetical protein
MVLCGKRLSSSVKKPDVVANYEQKYNETMTLLKQLGDGKERQDAYRTPQVRYPVELNYGFYWQLYG